MQSMTYLQRLTKFTHRKSEAVFSTKTLRLGGFSKKRLVLKSRNLDSEVVFVSCRRVSKSEYFLAPGVF